MLGPEATFKKNHVMPFLRSLPNCYARSINLISLRGVPDILCCINGVFVSLELKAEYGQPTKLQSFELDKIKKAGGIGLIVRPSTWEETKILLNKLAGVKND